MSAGKRKKRSVVGRICGITGTLLIVAVILLCSLLVFPEIFGFHVYNVISGSMEPEIKVGSLIYVQETEPEGIEEKDVIAFFSSVEDGSIITHRVVNNSVVSGTFTTKGDANSGEDPTPVPYDNFIGKVVLVLPCLGEVLTIMTSFYGKIGAASVILLGVVLNLIGSRLREA
ncbi:MAG: signal peptidase I [Lachnospiraceae bacterium]|jgi:signal peptidase